MYGSYKPSTDEYRLTTIYNNNLKNITHKHDTVDNDNLIKYYSVYNNIDKYNSSNLTPENTQDLTVIEIKDNEAINDKPINETILDNIQKSQRTI